MNDGVSDEVWRALVSNPIFLEGILSRGGQRTVRLCEKFCQHHADGHPNCQITQTGIPPEKFCDGFELCGGPVPEIEGNIEQDLRSGN